MASSHIPLDSKNKLPFSWRNRCNVEQNNTSISLVFPRYITHHILRKRPIRNDVSAETSTGTHLKGRVIRRVSRGGRQRSHPRLFRGAAFWFRHVLDHRVFVTTEVYIRHISSCWVLFLLIARRDISMYIHVFHCTYMYYQWKWGDTQIEYFLS